MIVAATAVAVAATPTFAGASPSQGPTSTPAASAGTSTTTSTPGNGGDVDLLRADADQVRATLAATVAKRADAEARLSSLRAEAAAARAAVEAARASEAAAAKRARTIDRQVRAAAVRAYVADGHQTPFVAIAADDAQQASWQSTVLQYRADELSDLLTRQRDAERRLSHERRARADAAAAADAAEQRTRDEVASLSRLEDEQSALVSQADDRLDAALAEAAALAAVDEQAAATLARQEQDLRNAVAQSLPDVPATPANGIPASKPASPAVTAPPTTAKPKPSPTSTAPPSPPSPGTTIPTPPSVDVVNVGGFVVARSISGPFGQMLNAMRGAGLVVGGSAYRDINVQISLRRDHCGPTDYDVWLRPSSQCSPPTAIPGRSMHERGLAIDFTCDRVLLTRSDPCFAWLARNAATYGFYNLPSEPWHWSTNGN